MVVPLRARGRILGAITFAFAESRRHYDQGDLDFAEELARRAAVAIDNARLYESEQNARQNADLANRAKDDFLATVSHELRTPLNAMLGWTRMLRDGKLPEDKRERALETFRAKRGDTGAADRGSPRRLADHRGQAPPRRPCRRPRQHRRASDGFARSRPRGEGDPDHDRARPRGGADSGRRAPVAAGRVEPAQQRNQVQPKGGLLEIALQRVDAGLSLAVRDNGTGINREFLPHVFERLRQADGGTTRAYGGLGLGLAISRHIVELHGGSIEVCSKGEGQGSTFTVVLPLLSLRREERATPPRVASLSLGVERDRRPELQGLKVLVVDDEEDARTLVVTVLERCGAVGLFARSAAEGLSKLASERPDVLLSDIGMPGEDGFAFLRAVRALPASEGGNIPAAALTAYARAEDRRTALDAGYMMHVTKPVEPAELISVIASLARAAPPRR